MPVGIARILEARDNAVLVHASATAATIDEDAGALTRIVWLDATTGTSIDNWTYPPSGVSESSTVADPLVDGSSVAFQSGNSVYVYSLATSPDSQQPLRASVTGRLVAFHRGTLYVQSDDGLYAIALQKSSTVKTRVLAYDYDATQNEPAPVQTEDTFAVSDGSVVQVFDMATNTAHRYAAKCPQLASIFRSGNNVAFQCETTGPQSAGTVYVARLSGP